MGHNAFAAGGGAVAIGDTANANFTNIAIGAGAMHRPPSGHGAGHQQQGDGL
jgi:hypothetical protein